MIRFEPCSNLAISAALTFCNMQHHYKRFAPDWDETRVFEQISSLDNWDILLNEQVVGAMRIAYDEACCYLRDLQVDNAYQNRGIGARAIDQANELAKEHGAITLALRVLKVSAAYRLYLREGFNTVKEDERFYYMERQVT